MKLVSHLGLIKTIRQNVITRRYQRGFLTILNKDNPELVRDSVVKLIQNFTEDVFESTETFGRVAVIVPIYPISLLNEDNTFHPSVEIDGNERDNFRLPIMDSHDLVHRLMEPTESLAENGKDFIDNIPVFNKGFDFDIPFKMTHLTQRIWDANGVRDTQNVMTLIFVSIDAISSNNHHYIGLMKYLATNRYTHKIVISDELNPTFISGMSVGVSGFDIPTLHVTILDYHIIENDILSKVKVDESIIYNLLTGTRLIRFVDEEWAVISDFIPTKFIGFPGVKELQNIREQVMCLDSFTIPKHTN